MAEYVEVIAELRPRNGAEFPLLDLKYLYNGTDAQGNKIPLSQTLEKIKEIAEAGDNDDIIRTQQTHGDKISTLETKTTKISYNASTGTTISGKIVTDSATYEEVSNVGGANEYLAVLKDKNGQIIQFIDYDGGVHFAGDVYAPNIDNLLGDLKSQMTVSLSQNQKEALKRVLSVESQLTNQLSRLTAAEAGITNLGSKTLNITGTAGKTTISGSLILDGETLDTQDIGNGEYISAIKDKNGNILEWTDSEGNKHFAGDVYAPNIDNLLAKFDSELSVSLNKATAALSRDVATAKGDISALQAKTALLNEFSNPEYLKVVRDSSGNILSYIDVVGDTYFTGELHAPNIDDIFAKLDAEVAVAMDKTASNLSRKVVNLESSVGKLQTIYSFMDAITNSEYAQLTKDSLGNILAYTDLSGDTYFTGELHAPNIDDLRSEFDELKEAAKLAAII